MVCKIQKVAQHFRYTCTFSGFDSSMTQEVRREAIAFGMRAETKRRRFLATSSVSDTLSNTPDAILKERMLIG